MNEDLVIRVALVLDDDDDDNFNEELSPSVWRRFQVSAEVNLDLLHDKVLAPIMGWTRNYHTYLMRKLPPSTATSSGSSREVSSTRKTCYYLQQDTNAVDLMHASLHTIDAEDSDVIAPETVKIGELLTTVGDRVLYIYDLGDCWRHVLTLEERLSGNDANGRITVLDGAMRCPNEDGEGCRNYQETILKLVNDVTAVESNEHDAVIPARKLATACFDLHNDSNVRGSFRPCEFSVKACQQAVDAALQTRNWARNSIKVCASPPGVGPFGGFHMLEVARAGQCFVKTKIEDDRRGDDLFLMTRGETINIKPDPIEQTLCNVCGNPNGLLLCSLCKSKQYCSKSCQTKAWKQLGHKCECKRELQQFNRYQKQLNDDDDGGLSRVVNGGFDYWQKYDPNNLRLSVGDRVECRVGPGDDDYATGVVVNTMYRENTWPVSRKSAPYQIKLDARFRPAPMQSLIFSEWDDDFFIRPLRKSTAEKKQAKTKQSSRKHTRKNRSPITDVD